MHKTIWVAARTHGEMHPTVPDSAHFCIEAMDWRAGRLSGFVSLAEFRKLARRFGVSAATVPYRSDLPSSAK